MFQTASRFLAESVDFITVELVFEGLVASSVTVHRDKLTELALSTAPSSDLISHLEIKDAKTDIDLVVEQARLSWDIAPYLEYSLFDPLAPIMGEVGVKFTSKYKFSSAMSVQGEIRKSIFNNYNANTRVSDSVLPRVRSESNLYNQQGDPGITSLTFQSLNKLSPNT